MKALTPLAAKTSFIRNLLALAVLAAFVPLSLRAQVPPVLSYQGHVAVQGQSANFTGSGSFKFAIIDANDQTLWSHDGTSVNGSPPQSAIAIAVEKGFFSVHLGDTSLPNMQPLPPSVFQQASDVWLRVWFDDGVHGEQQLTPDQRLVSVAFAMVAGNSAVSPGSIDSTHLAGQAVDTVHLANGAVGSAQLAPNAVGSAALQDHLDLGSPGNAGSLDIFGTTGVRLFDTAGGPGLVNLHTHIPGFSNSGGYLDLHESGGDLRLRLSGAGKSYARFYQGNNNTGVSINGSHGSSTGGGSVFIYQGDGDIGLTMRGDSGGAGFMDVRNALGQANVKIDGQGTGDAGELLLYDGGNQPAISLKADNGNWIFGGPVLALNNGSSPAATLSGTLGGYLGLYGTENSPTISLSGLDGRITTKVLEITGGSDLSEQFDIHGNEAEVAPGTLVCVDPQNPGDLIPSTRAYDPTVAGVISGAGGVNPGMIMGQRGSVAHGKHPVALTGRVYCKVDASHGVIQPGDLITTSDTPGHGMKATDRSRSHGAIIGKAMTGLEAGKGLVLVLVSLQ